MQPMRLADVPTDRTDRVFAYSRLRAVLAAALLAASALATFLVGWLNAIWLACYAGVILLSPLLIFHRLITARFRPSNWLLRATNDGLFIKFRSYLNHHFDDRDLTVVYLPCCEIRSAKALREIGELPARTTGKRQETVRSARRVVEFEVSSDCTALAKLLANERERVFGKSAVGAGRVSTRYQHLPVRLAGPKRLQIEWGVVPDPRTLLGMLAGHSIPQESTAVVVSFPDLEKLPKPQQEEYLLRLAEGGDKLGAVALARRLYAYDLAAAKAFIEELVRRHGGD